MRLIDADALERAFTALRWDENGKMTHWGDRCDWCLHGYEVEQLLAKAPTIGTDQRTAKWIPEHEERRWYCSNCRRLQGQLSATMKYCPECGAKMEPHPWMREEGF